MLQVEHSAILLTFINISYQLLLRSLLCLFLSDRFTQVLLKRQKKMRGWSGKLNDIFFSIKVDGCFGKMDMQGFNLVLFDLILYTPSTIFQLCREESSWVEPVLS